jgi:hypothetical protein
MKMLEEYEPSRIGKEGRNEGLGRVRFAAPLGSLRSPALRREADSSPGSVTHAVSMKCYLCGDRVPSVAPPKGRMRAHAD